MPKRFLFLIALFWSLFIAALCLVKSNDLPAISIPIPYFDKVIHFSLHFIFTFLWSLFFVKHNFKSDFKMKIFYAVCFSIGYGIVIEIIQGLFTVTRSADTFDVLANITGATTAFFVVLLFKDRIQKNDTH